MPSIELTVNGTRHVVDAGGEVPLLWVLRDVLGLTGTKYGCGEGSCGACTVLDGDEPTRSCLVTLGEAAGRSYTTIEGLEARGGGACRRAWLDEDVAQCGYCQGGMLLQAWSLLRSGGTPTDDEIDDAFAHHICRCGTYPRIRRAIRRAASAAAMRSSTGGGAK